MRIAILITCHNRRNTTMKCLRHVNDQKLADNVKVRVYLVDDGSTDGTGESVRAEFPEITVITGDGSLYWNQGMRRAWEEADQDAHDAYIWLNDDTMLCPYALCQMLRVMKEQKLRTGNAGIVVGASGVIRKGGEQEGVAMQRKSAQKGACERSNSRSSDFQVTYGGYVNGVLVRPTEEVQLIDYFNGNLVLVPNEVFSVIGNLSEAYRHSFGDFDYGIRARQAGFPVWLSPGILAECTRERLPKWRDAQVPIIERWRDLHSPRGIAARELVHFLRIQDRTLPWMSVVKLYLRVIFPVWFRADN